MEVLDETRHRLLEARRRVGHEPAHPDEAGHHPHPGDHLVDLQDPLPVAPGVEERGLRAQVQGVGAEPDQVAADPGQLDHDHADPLGPLRHGLAQQLLDCQRVAQVVAGRAEVVHAVGPRRALVVGDALEVLLEAGVEVADVGVGVAHHLALNAQHQAQDAVGAGVLRAHVELHQRAVGGLAHVLQALAEDRLRRGAGGRLDLGFDRRRGGLNHPGAPRARRRRAGTSHGQ